MSKQIKHADLRVGMELHYKDPRNAGWFGVIMRVIPRIADYPGRGWTRYYVCQKNRDRISPYGVNRTIGELNRDFTFPVPAAPAAQGQKGASDE